MKIFKDHLPAGWSYALKPSRLERAIADAGIRLPVSLHQHYKVWEANPPVLSAQFFPRGSPAGGEDGHFAVVSCAIQSSERDVAQAFAEQVFIPALVAWIISIEALSYDSTIRREKQTFVCEGAPLAVSMRSLALIPKGKRRPKRG